MEWNSCCYSHVRLSGSKLKKWFRIFINITESQNQLSWKGPMRIIECSSLPCTALFPRATPCALEYSNASHSTRIGAVTYSHSLEQV